MPALSAVEGALSQWLIARGGDRSDYCGQDSIGRPTYHPVRPKRRNSVRRTQPTTRHDRTDPIEQLPRNPRCRARALRRIPGRVLPQGRRAARLPRGLRQRTDRGRLAGGADPAGIRRLRPGPDRSLGHHGRNQPQRRQFRCLPRPDVQHGHAVAPRFPGAEGKVPAQDRLGRMAPAVDGRDRAHHRHRHHQDQDLGGQEGRPLCRQRPEGVDQPRAAQRLHDPAGAHHGACRREEEERRHVHLHGGPA
ncbi:hypothetical protein D9M69_389660 [compost metagenome]